METTHTHKNEIIKRTSKISLDTSAIKESKDTNKIIDPKKIRIQRKQRVLYANCIKSKIKNINSVFQAFCYVNEEEANAIINRIIIDNKKVEDYNN